MRRLILTDDEARLLAETGEYVVVRVMKVQPPSHWSEYYGKITVGQWSNGVWRYSNTTAGVVFAIGNCPFGKVGDVVWCAESWAYWGGNEYIYQKSPGAVMYKTGEECRMALLVQDWRSPAIMPQWASRSTATIEAIDVREVEGVWSWAARIRKGEAQC